MNCIDNDIFAYGWDRKNSYAFGWVMSDGCLRREGRNKTAYAVRICSNDRDIIEWLHSYMCVGNKIYKQNEKGHLIKFRNKESIDFMICNGLKERKSLDMKFPDIPEAYLGDFIRGYFDGDGSIILHPNRYNTYAQISFTCGSIAFIEGLKQALKRFRIESHIYKDGRPNNNSYFLRVIKRSEIEKIINLMYFNVLDGAYLNRKYIKCLEYLDCKPKYKVSKTA